MNNFAICIGRQLGSGGREIAKLVADSMGLPFYDKEIITVAAAQSGLASELFERADEKPSSNIMGNVTGMSIPFIYDGVVSQNSFICNDNLFHLISDAILKLYEGGPSVFVGRCADYVLRDKQNVLTVFITANDKDRIARLCRYENITQEEAAVKIRESDKKRAEYYGYYTFKKWGNAASYDMCLNTSVLGIQEIVERIIRLAKRKWRQNP